MEAAHLERLEELLAGHLGQIPETAARIDIDVPRSIAAEATVGWEDALIAGREVQVHYAHQEREDSLVLEWHDEHGARRVQGYVSTDPGLGETGRRVYHLARRARASSEDAHTAAVQADTLEPGAAELCVRLLKDGTRWDRAISLATLAVAL